MGKASRLISEQSNLGLCLFLWLGMALASTQERFFRKHIGKVRIMMDWRTKFLFGIRNWAFSFKGFLRRNMATSRFNKEDFLCLLHVSLLL